MTSDAPSAHPSDARATSTAFASDTLSGLAELGVDVVVIGGWAVRLYGSPVFSIDLDILIPPLQPGDYAIYDFLDARTDHHRSAYEDSYLEAKESDEPNRLWITGESYIPGDLVAKYGRRHYTVTVDGFAIEADVPTPEVLAFMKLKAMLNRANKLHALRNPSRLAMLDGQDREQIEGIREGFMVRKVAKDIVDIAYLVENHVGPDEVLEVVASTAMGKALRNLAPWVSEELYDEADRITKEYGLALDCRASVRRLLEDLPAARA